MIEYEGCLSIVKVLNELVRRETCNRDTRLSDHIQDSDFFPLFTHLLHWGYNISHSKAPLAKTAWVRGASRVRKSGNLSIWKTLVVTKPCVRWSSTVHPRRLNQWEVRHLFRNENEEFAVVRFWSKTRQPYQSQLQATCNIEVTCFFIGFIGF